MSNTTTSDMQAGWRPGFTLFDSNGVRGATPVASKSVHIGNDKGEEYSAYLVAESAGALDIWTVVQPNGSEFNVMTNASPEHWLSTMAHATM